MPRVSPLPIKPRIGLIKFLTLYALTHAVAAKKQIQPQVSTPLDLTASGIELRNQLKNTGAAQQTNGAQGVNGVNGADGGEPPQTPIEKLEKLGLRNITREAREGQLDPVFERSEEMAELSKRLKGGNNALLIGDTGVGKTAVLEGLAQEWKDEEKTFFFSLGMKDLDRSVLEPQLKEIVETAQEAYRQGYSVYILMDELHLHEQAGVLELLKEPLARPGFQVVGATTTKEFYQYFNNDATKRRFGDPLKIEALTGDKLRRLVRNVIPVILERLKGAERIEVPPRSRQAAIELSPLIIGRFPPDATIALLKEAIGSKRSQLGDLRRIVAETPKKLADDINDLIEYSADSQTRAQLETIWKSVIGIVAAYLESEAMAEKVTEELAKTGCLTIMEDDIRAQASKMAGLDLRKLDELDIQQLSQIEARIRTRFIGQDQAVEKVAGAIKRYKTGRRKKQSPIATFLFTGPTGTGKTELAHTLAWLLFSNPDKVMTIDMTKCEGRGGKTLLFGPDPGFVGFDKTEGMLPELLKRKENRHGVLLLDEIDKADREVYESLLVMLDQGYIQNKKTGEKYSLEDIVVIMASNQGEAQMIKPGKMRELAETHLNQQTDQLQEQLREARGDLTQASADGKPESKREAQERISELEKEQDNLTRNRPQLIKEILQRLIAENRRIASASFKTQTDESGREKYPPAFLNRLEIIPFDFLIPEELSAIADIQLKNFVSQVERDQKLEIVIGENAAEYQAVKQFILEKGTDLSNGARPLKHSIENNLDNPFSAWLVNNLPSGEYIIKASVKDGQLVIKETGNKSQRGRQMDISTIRGRRGIILRRIAELTAAGKEVADTSLKDILAPAKGLTKIELWFEENPFPANDAPAQSAALARIKASLTSEDLNLIEKDLIKLLKSENPGLLALGLSMAVTIRPLKLKEIIQTLNTHKYPFIAKLAQEALSKLEEATEYKSPSGKIIISAGDKSKIDPKVSALLAGIEELVPEKIREAVRRGIHTLVYIAKERQEKVEDAGKQALPLTVEWEINPFGEIEVRVSNSDTQSRPEETRLKQFREKYLNLMGSGTSELISETETILSFQITGLLEKKEIELPAISALPLDSELAPLLAALEKLGGEKLAIVTSILNKLVKSLREAALSHQGNRTKLQDLIRNRITRCSNPDITTIEDILSNPDEPPEARQWAIKELLSLSEAPALPKITGRLEEVKRDIKITIALSSELTSEAMDDLRKKLTASLPFDKAEKMGIKIAVAPTKSSDGYTIIIPI